jgi:trigger factor
LKIDSERLEDHQVKLTVEFEDEIFEGAKRRAARQIAKRTKIPGFRPGKAPYHIIVRTVGEQPIIERGLEFLIDDQYPKVIEEAKVDPYGPGQLEEIVSVEPLVLEFVVPLAAEIELGDYRSIRIPYELEEIDEDDIDEVLDNLRQSQAIEEPTDRPAQEGDRVYLRLSGKRAILEEGKDEFVINEREHSVVIQPEDPEEDIEWPYTGFSREIIGMTTGDEKTFTYTYPQNSDFESLAGIPVEFHVQLEEIKSRTLPDLDDEFAQSIGDFDTLEDLRTEIKANLERQTKENYENEYDEELLTQIIDQSKIEYPPQMLEEEIDLVIRRLERQLEAQNLDLETYLLTQGMSEQDFREESTPIAETRLKRTLVLLEISKAEDIQLDEKKLQTETERTINSLTRFMSASDKKKMRSEGVLANLAGNIAAEMAINQTLDFIRSMARGELDETEESEETEQTKDIENLVELPETKEDASPDTELETEPVKSAEDMNSSDETREVTSEQDIEE